MKEKDLIQCVRRVVSLGGWEVGDLRIFSQLTNSVIRMRLCIGVNKS